MKHLFLLTRPAIAIVALTIAHISFASNQEVQEGPGEALAKMIEKGEALATPGSSHAFLEQLTGKWKTTSTVMGSEPQFGTAKAEMILGGRFLEMSYEGDFMGIKLKGKTILGYDNYKHKFTGVFLDNLNTSIRTAEGTLDQSGKILSLWGTIDEWMTDEHDKPVSYRYRIMKDGTIALEVHDLTIVDGETQVVEITFRKL